MLLLLMTLRMNMKSSEDNGRQSVPAMQPSEQVWGLASQLCQRR
jgi:hypothetical protein